MLHIFRPQARKNGNCQQIKRGSFDVERLLSITTTPLRKGQIQKIPQIRRWTKNIIKLEKEF